jgi:AcrR family transcriptional regulator
MTATPGRGRPRDPGADAAILRAGLELFVQRGIEGTSIEAIAKRAGVGKLTVYRRWVTKEQLIAAAIESTVASEVAWPPAEEIDEASPYEMVEGALSNAANTVAAPEFRALMARVLGTAVSHPSLIKTYWDRYVLPRRELARRLLENARKLGTVKPDTDPEILIDMMVGAVMWRVLQPDSPDADEMRRYLRAVYRQVGLLP